MAEPTDFDGVIAPQPAWADIPQLSTQAIAMGGEGGSMNAQAVALAARIAYLQLCIELLAGGQGGASSSAQ